MLLSLVPEIHGRSAAGVSATKTGHARPTTAIAAPPASICRAAFARPAGAIHSHAAAIPGTTISATAIFVSKPSPTATPAKTSQRVRPSSNARTRHHTAATQQSTSSASGLLWRDTATAIGVSASVRPAAKPATRPKRRRVRSYTRATVATPISACGTSTLSELKPKTRADSAWTQSASGGLSTVITPLASNDPYRKLCQLELIERTAAE
jgi:hypothetical protein